MKRAKIMLMSIAVLATVGSALAFKVAKKGTTPYCYERTTVKPSRCLQEITQAKAEPVVNEQVYYYITKTAPCDQLDCNKTAEFFSN